MHSAITESRALLYNYSVCIPAWARKLFGIPRYPGDAVVAWENKKPSRQLKKENTDRSPGKVKACGLHRGAR
ncbi:hypothetical protein OYC64_000513 [Pagothenia borchgrevinki]|uniref:Uncharacterized protein n=1 Tax=Pagothenia borchgrevinki TaxID=8213 RepID=A0ABD2HD59_PAGBO